MIFFLFIAYTYGITVTADNFKDLFEEKTLEYQICKANVFPDRRTTRETWLFELINHENADGISKVEAYMNTIANQELSEVEQQNTALLMWKCLPSKAGFAQTLNAFLLDKVSAGVETKFTVPSYIQDAINHLVP